MEITLNNRWIKCPLLTKYYRFQVSSKSPTKAYRNSRYKHDTFRIKAFQTHSYTYIQMCKTSVLQLTTGLVSMYNWSGWSERSIAADDTDDGVLYMRIGWSNSITRTLRHLISTISNFRHCREHVQVLLNVDNWYWK